MIDVLIRLAFAAEVKVKRVTQQVYSPSTQRLIGNPRNLVQYKIEHLLLKQCLILANKVFISATGPLRPCSPSESRSQVSKVSLELAKYFLRVLWIRLRG